jgi:hypothetical protein
MLVGVNPLRNSMILTKAELLKPRFEKISRLAFVMLATFSSVVAMQIVDLQPTATSYTTAGGYKTIAATSAIPRVFRVKSIWSKCMDS